MMNKMNLNEKLKCPLLKYPENYNPDSLDLENNPEAREYWLDCLDQMAKKFVGKVKDLQPDDPSATEKAEECYREFHTLIEKVTDDSEFLKPLSIRTLLNYNDDCIRRRFKDPWERQKKMENSIALSKFKSRIDVLDSKTDLKDKWLDIIRGVLAGNFFDWAAKAVKDILENRHDFGFEEAATTVQKRPWFVDKFDEFYNRLETRRYEKCVIFLDNSGIDFILGILPLVRELLSQGTEVILAANTYPTLNDITYSELNIYCDRAAKYCEILKGGLDNGKLITAENGQKGPCLDLSVLSAELCELMKSVDLIIIEGMGRAIHTNINTKFTVDCLKLSVIKNEWLARYMGTKLFGIICDFDST
ncbi:4'-phosphopantetheine phosphatase-like [Diorhabda carinulata]|uniref:4'-phosphopantetheine phosphatase-like n=1 Tax=Diorhabda carinulata TaxID=1163345 RepID=UPI0025A0A549|nr:4'-phosphopantetheine phosphatase-like [Diorhabda carinulata]